MLLKDLPCFPFMPCWQRGRGVGGKDTKASPPGMRICLEPVSAPVGTGIQDSCPHPVRPSQQRFPKHAVGAADGGAWTQGASVLEEV